MNLLIVFSIYQLIRQTIKCHKIMKNVHHNFLKPKVTSSHCLIGWTNSLKPLKTLKVCKIKGDLFLQKYNMYKYNINVKNNVLICV